MTTRRRFLRTAAASTLLAAGHPWAFPPATGAGDRSRMALVIGNDRYRGTPLENAVNDARAVGELLARAGFAVDRQLNATRQQMARAIDELGRVVGAAAVDLVLFYYAGHAAQLNWRNYLLPVDGDVESSGDVSRQCIDLGDLLARLAKARGKTAIIILDACRDDPFGSRYRPKLKGLSQYDAPAGTLLAFATAPGSVAIEVPGRKHGLYTEHLVRELSVKGVRLEDALKRVRLNVRVASRGAQIPWESTSLESDIFLFPSAKLSEAELEAQFREELALWNRIKHSQNADDWVRYLRHFPHGKFAEVGQLRLNRLLAAQEPPGKAAGGAASRQGLQLGPKLRIPPHLQGSENPHSAGTFPFRPVWTVGDEYVFQELDLYSGVVQRTRKLAVRRVDVERDRVEFSDGVVANLLGNVTAGGRNAFDIPIQLNPAELQVGKKWVSPFRQSGRTQGVGEYAFRVLTREKIKVPAGEFSAFKIEGSGWFNAGGAVHGIRHTRWVVPGLNLEVRRERYQFGDARVLVSARQRVSG